MNTQNVLLVVSEEGQLRAGWSERLNQLKLLPEAEIYILYVVPDLPSAYCVLPSVAWLNAAWMDDAYTTLRQLQAFYGLDASRVAIAQGSAYHEAVRHALAKGCLRIVGDVEAELPMGKTGWLAELVHQFKLRCLAHFGQA